jgi:ABC-type transporter Mla subunit MlaD
MAIPEIKIKVGADTSALAKDLGEAQSAVNTFARAAEASGSQAGDAFDRAGQRVKSSFRDMASSVLREISAIAGPAAIAGAAFSAVLAAAQSYISGVLDKTPQVDETLKNHAKLIRDLKAAYGESLVGLERFTKETDDAFRNRMGAQLTLLQTQVQGLGATFISQFTTAISSIDSVTGQLQETGYALFQLPAKFEPFRAAFEQFYATVRSGNPDFVAFKNEVDRIGGAAATTNPQLNQTAKELADNIKLGYQAQQAIGATSSAMTQLAPEARKAAEEVNRFNAAIKALDAISPKEKSKRYQIDEEYLKGRLGVADENKLRELARARDDAIARFEAEEAEKNKGKGGGGSGYDAAAAEAEAERARIQSRLEIIKQGLMTREMMEAESLAKNEALVNEAFEKKIVSEQEKNALLEQMKAEHLAKIEAMEAAAQQRGVDLLVKGGKQLATAFEGNSKKMTGVAKTFGAVEALINALRAFNQVLADPSLPWFAKFGAAASVLAAGMQTVNAIKSISDSGGGGRGGSGGGGSRGSGAAVAAPAQPAQAERSMYLTIQGQFFDRETMRGLAEQMAAFQKDGGGRIVIA